MKKIILLAFLIVVSASGRELIDFIEPNGCGYAFVTCHTNLLNEIIPVGAHPLGQIVTVNAGVTNTVQKTIREFVIFVRDNKDGTAVVKLSARQGTYGRMRPVTIKDLALWNFYLTNYNLDVSKWMTLSEYRAAYPQKRRK